MLPFGHVILCLHELRGALYGQRIKYIKQRNEEDAKLYNCIKELYDQGVPFEELKALIPDMKRTREQLRIKRMLENQ